MTGCEPLSPANSVAVMDCVMAPVSSSGRRQHARELKRSVIGVRVAAQGLDGRYYTGTIEHVRTHVEFGEKLKEPLYHVRFDRGHRGEFKETEMVGPGFRPVSSVKLRAGQLVYITYNGREVSGVVVHHRPQIDEVVVSIQREGSESPFEVKRRVEDIRLLESRRSPRLMDSEVDFAKLADVGVSERKRNQVDRDIGPVSRKRRTSHSEPSESDSELGEPMLDECSAAMVLMSLSCSPRSPLFIPGSSEGSLGSDRLSPDSVASSRSPVTLSVDEGIVIEDGIVDMDDTPASEGIYRTVYQCTWKGCHIETCEVKDIERHIRQEHLGPRPESEPQSVPAGEDNASDREVSEEEFYYIEKEVPVKPPPVRGPPPGSPFASQLPVQSPPPSSLQSSPPTLSHMDMARPAHENPEIHAHTMSALPINIPGRQSSTTVWQHPYYITSASPLSPSKHMKLSPKSSSLPKVSVLRQRRSDSKKCRKIYGVENRELWCTQCKWKKACTRFMD